VTDNFPKTQCSFSIIIILLLLLLLLLTNYFSMSIGLPQNNFPPNKRLTIANTHSPQSVNVKARQDAKQHSA